MTARRPFFVYADEFHAFASDSLMAMLPQLHKHGDRDRQLPSGIAHAGRWWKRAGPGKLTLMEEMDPRLEAHLKLCHEIYLRMRAEGTWPWADSQFSEDLVDSDSQPNEP